MGFGSRAFLAGSVGFAAAFVVACGGSNGLLSADENSSLTSQLNSVSSAIGAHQCGEAASAAAALTNAVANLPPSVTTTLVQNLGQGAGTVSQLAQRDCTTSTPVITTSTSPTTTSTTTSSTTTTTSSTTTGTGTSSSSATGTATNPPPTGTSTSSNGGAGVGSTGTSGTGQGSGGGGVGGGNGQ